MACLLCMEIYIKMDEGILHIHEGKKYKLQFSDKANIYWPIALLDGVTNEKIGDKPSMLVFTRYPTYQWDWCPKLMLKDIPGATLLIRLQNVQSIYWREQYSSGFTIWIKAGKPYIHFDGYEPTLVDYRQDNV